jgi:hypothetical protein
MSGERSYPHASPARRGDPEGRSEALSSTVPNVGLPMICSPKRTGRNRPDYVTLNRHRAQDRTLGFAPISAAQPTLADYLERTLQQLSLWVSVAPPADLGLAGAEPPLSTLSSHAGHESLPPMLRMPAEDLGARA